MDWCFDGDSSVEDEYQLYSASLDDTLTASRRSPCSRSSSDDDSTSSCGDSLETYSRAQSNLVTLQYGFITKPSYSHPARNGDVTSVTYNSRLGQFVIVDGSGITLWNDSLIGDVKVKVFPFPSYQHHLIRHIIHVNSYNVYFVITNDRRVKILNKNFEEAFFLKDSHSILDLVYNSAKHELITSGVDGLKFWEYKRHSQTGSDKKTTVMSQFVLQHRKTVVPPLSKDHWVHKLQIDMMSEDKKIQKLYCMAACDLLFYDLEGDFIAKWEGLHDFAISSCIFIPRVKFYVTSGRDSCVKIWTEMGSLVTQFSTHIKPVIQVIVHPESDVLLLSGSLDGTVRMWNLLTMTESYSTSVCEGGLLSMNVMHTNNGWMLYVAARRAINMFNLNHLLDFWSETQCRMLSLSLAGSKSKTGRVTAVGEDNSVRIFSRETGATVTMVLPPPTTSLLTSVKAAVYSRQHSLIYILINEREIWVYTTRTNPCCRIDVWDGQMLDSLVNDQLRLQLGKKAFAVVISCMCLLCAPITVMTDEGESCCNCCEFLVLGLQDGRLIIADGQVRGLRHVEISVSTGSVVHLVHDSGSNTLLTMCQAVSHFNFQVWSLPELQLLETVTCNLNVTCFTHKKNFLFCGHENGDIHLHSLSSFGGSTSFFGDSSGMSVVDDTQGHVGTVCSVDSHEYLNIFLSTGMDGYMKIWDTHKTLLREVDLGSSLGAAVFLNNFGDILLSFQSQLYCMESSKFYPLSAAFCKQTHEEEIASLESAVFEDPSLKYDFVTNELTTDMETYLVPYSLPLKKSWLLDGGLLVTDHDVSDEEHDSQASDVASVTSSQHAPSDIYQSLQSSLCTSLIALNELNEFGLYEQTRSDIMNCEKPTLGLSPVSSPPQSPRQVDFIVEITSDQEEDRFCISTEEDSLSLPMQSASVGVPLDEPKQTKLDIYQLSQKKKHSDVVSSIESSRGEEDSKIYKRPSRIGSIKIDSSTLVSPRVEKGIYQQNILSQGNSSDSITTVVKSEQYGASDDKSRVNVSMQRKSKDRKKRISQRRQSVRQQLRSKEVGIGQEINQLSIPQSLINTTNHSGELSANCCSKDIKELIQSDLQLQGTGKTTLDVGNVSTLQEESEMSGSVEQGANTEYSFAVDRSNRTKPGYSLISDEYLNGSAAVELAQYQANYHTVSMTSSNKCHLRPLSAVVSDTHSDIHDRDDDMLSVISSQGTLVCLVPGTSIRSAESRASILSHHLSDCSTVKFGDGITAIEIKDPTWENERAIDLLKPSRHFSLPDVSTYDNTWADRVVARSKVKREQLKERALSAAARRHLGELNRLYGQLFVSRHSDCHNNSSKVAERVSSAPNFYTNTQHYARKTDYSQSSLPHKRQISISSLSTFDNTMLLESDGCPKSTSLKRMQESEFGLHKKSLAGSLQFRCNIGRQSKDAGLLAAETKVLQQSSCFEPRVHCSIPTKPRFYVLSDGKSKGRKPVSQTPSHLESQLLKARFGTCLPTQRIRKQATVTI